MQTDRSKLPHGYGVGVPRDLHACAATRLVQRMYAYRGLRGPQAAVPKAECETRLVAHSGDDVIGTVSVRIDSGDGLLAEQLYPAEIRALRRPGARLAELTRLAMAPGQDSLVVLSALFQLAYAHCRDRHALTDVVIEVNPRHAGFYTRMVGFTEIGEERTCPRVAAPAVLLHLEIAEMDRRIEHCSRPQKARRRSIYDYFPGAGLHPARASLPSLSVI